MAKLSLMFLDSAQKAAVQQNCTHPVMQKVSQEHHTRLQYPNAIHYISSYIISPYHAGFLDSHKEVLFNSRKYYFS